MPHHNGTIHIIVLFVTIKLNYYLQMLENNKDVFAEKVFDMANMEHWNMICGKDQNAGPGRKGLSIQLITLTYMFLLIAHY